MQPDTGPIRRRRTIMLTTGLYWVVPIISRKGSTKKKPGFSIRYVKDREE